MVTDWVIKQTSDIIWVVCNKHTTIWATNKKTARPADNSGTYGVTKYGSGWRKDVVNYQCLEFVAAVYSAAHTASAPLSRLWRRFTVTQHKRPFGSNSRLWRRFTVTQHTRPFGSYSGGGLAVTQHTRPFGSNTEQDMAAVYSYSAHTPVRQLQRRRFGSYSAHTPVRQQHWAGYGGGLQLLSTHARSAATAGYGGGFQLQRQAMAAVYSAHTALATAGYGGGLLSTHPHLAATAGYGGGLLSTHGFSNSGLWRR